jgi:hypothetical protein
MDALADCGHVGGKKGRVMKCMYSDAYDDMTDRLKKEDCVS